MPDITTEPRSTKNQRINLRATERQEAVLRRAAEATDHSLTDFILSSAVEQAQRVLADRRWFSATEEQYAEFLRLLDEPLPSTAKFDRLFARRSRFAEAG
ncbi:DUF1778 domain-containing protein [Protaetiibacter larvae]|uniref:DUF1778 domain-containing protein n=1 Tax=Protaetiibacter larvae TaxID=2592654 RepID=A0A5C1Y7V1_9MICO|nr:DUF1778 domain-containing protein [Protaetiibacter larvae]QEO09931.1 DUF1778 domain-containing protein [Protaetiibacter larvae]